MEPDGQDALPLMMDHDQCRDKMVSSVHKHRELARALYEFQRVDIVFQNLWFIFDLPMREKDSSSNKMMNRKTDNFLHFLNQIICQRRRTESN